MFVYLTFEGALLSQYASDSSAQWTNVMAFRRLMGLLMIPSAMVLSIGIAGASRVYRRLLFNEGVFLREDFIIGIKKNWGGCLGKAFLSSLICYALYASMTFFGPDAISYYLFLYILVGVLFLLIITANMYFAFLNDLYSDPFIKKIGVSYVLSFKDPVSFFLVASLTSVPLVILFYIDGLSFLVTAIILVVFTIFYPFMGLSIGGLVSSASSAKVADEAINKKYFPDFYRKGLFNGDSLR